MVTAGGNVGRLPRRRLSHAASGGSVRDGENGRLVDFFDVEALADRVVTALATNSDGGNNEIRLAARQTAVEHYDVHAVTLPAYLDLLRSLLCLGQGRISSTMIGSIEGVR